MIFKLHGIHETTDGPRVYGHEVDCNSEQEAIERLVRKWPKVVFMGGCCQDELRTLRMENLILRSMVLK